MTPAAGDGSANAAASGRTVFFTGSSTDAADTGLARRKPTTVHPTVHTRSSGEVSPGAVAVGTTAATTTAARRAPPVRAPAKAAVRRARGWTVQVASYETYDAAQAMQASLCERGYDTRIMGMSRPYGVRVGRFRTSAEAMTIARRLRSRQLTVFVTPAE